MSFNPRALLFVVSVRGHRIAVRFKLVQRRAKTEPIFWWEFHSFFQYLL
jgi:hypothetical protein